MKSQKMARFEKMHTNSNVKLLELYETLCRKINISYNTNQNRVEALEITIASARLTSLYQ